MIRTIGGTNSQHFRVRTVILSSALVVFNSRFLLVFAITACSEVVIKVQLYKLYLSHLLLYSITVICLCIELITDYLSHVVVIVTVNILA